MTKIGIQLKDENNNEVYPNPFPVGAIYLSLDSRNPSIIFGGTWELLKDRFLLGAGNKYPINSVGGEEKHTLSESEMPSHSHGVTYAYGSGEAYGMVWHNGNYQGPYYPDGLGVLKNTGGSQAHNNMPPYIAVYIWHRIA